MRQLVCIDLLCCSDMKLFSFEKLSSLVEQLLVIMAKKRQEKQVRRLD